MISLIPDSTVCFLGDSITANGGWIAKIAGSYGCAHPKDNVQFYNCGVSGTTLGDALTLYLAPECLSRKPYLVFVCYGINDINPGLYRREAEENAGSGAEKEAAFTRYRDNLDRVVRMILVSGANAVLLNPPAYDDVSALALPAYRCNEGLERCIGIQNEIAEQYGLDTVDLFTPFREGLTRGITLDRTHPNDLGDSIIASVLLASLGIGESAEALHHRPLSVTNRKRREIERKLRLLGFVRWQKKMPDEADGVCMIETNLAILKREADCRAAPWSEEVYEAYREAVFHEETMKKELAEYTAALAQAR